MNAIIIVLLLAAATGTPSEDMSNCPMHTEHMRKQAASNATAVDIRGDQAMGFSHERTRHHFTLTSTGGVIAVLATKPDDVASVKQIRQHLQHIARAFAAGDFSLPMFIHDPPPPGIDVMRQRKDQIHYHYEARSQGAQVVIATQDPAALAAIHVFLTRQIRDHRTGDSAAVAQQVPDGASAP